MPGTTMGDLLTTTAALMAEEFAQLEITLSEAAKSGNIDHIIALLKDVGKLHHLWQVTSASPTTPHPTSSAPVATFFCFRGPAPHLRRVVREVRCPRRGCDAAAVVPAGDWVP